MKGESLLWACVTLIYPTPGLLSHVSATLLVISPTLGSRDRSLIRTGAQEFFSILGMMNVKQAVPNDIVDHPARFPFKMDSRKV